MSKKGESRLSHAFRKNDKYIITKNGEDKINEFKSILREVFEEINLICDNCGKYSKKLFYCTCYNARYCSRECQKQHWPRHREENHTSTETKYADLKKRHDSKGKKSINDIDGGTKMKTKKRNIKKRNIKKRNTKKSWPVFK